ncbi:DUF221 domain-containing protein [Purpureocillium lavendulum]|uniref:DUF221 domain-containing protein n=1 Tax=Purpureocillium lavendulum TaxID=1247861 RepID=A0AB34G1M0_9HYPO|nr:DUF221 domain-containing protein [Purpureocillium lavendulum]
MPPKPSGRRRLSATNPRRDSDAASNSSLLKPNLPALRGTPSSRRQYSYGAAAEAAPKRPGGKGSLDLSHAVRQAMVRHGEEEGTEDGRSVSRPRSQSIPDPDEDELAGGSEAASVTAPRGGGAFQSIKSTFNGGSRASEADDTDDARSFGMESDYYGDATIASTPGGMPPPPRPDPQGSAKSLRPSKSRVAKPPANLSVPYSDLSDVGDTEESDGELDPSAKPIKIRHGSNAAALRRQKVALKIPTSRNGRPSSSDSRQVRSVSQDLEDTRTRLGYTTQAAVPSDAFSNKPHLPPQWTSGKQAPQPSGRRGYQTEQRQTEGRAESARWWQMPWRRTASPDDRSVESNRPATRLWQLLNPWTYVKAIVWLFLGLFHRLISIPLPREGSWRLLASIPQFLLRMWHLLVGCLQYLVASILGFASFLWPSEMRRRLSPYARWLPYIFGVAAAVILGVALSNVRFQGWSGGSLDDLWEPAGRGRWSVPGLSGVRGYLPSMSLPSMSVPSMSLPSVTIPSLSLPSMSWRSSSRWEDIFKAGDMGNMTPAKAEGIFKKMSRHMDALATANRLHDSAIKTLEGILPKVVHVDVRNGRPFISPDFYHALRDLMRHDESIFKLDETSERQLKAIMARLSKDSSFTAKLADAVADRSSQRGSWDSWLKDNQAKVRQMIGVEVEAKINSAGIGGGLSKLLRSYTGILSGGGKVVSRDEYMRYVRNEAASLRAEMRAEIAGLRPQMEKLVRESLNLATGGGPAAMTRTEITTLVNGLVHRGLADINLKALASGKIHAHWDAALKNQINYFSIGAGAIADPRYTSPEYDPFSSTYFSREDQKKASIRGPQPAMAALMPWKDVGDCFCAARSQSRRGNPHGASLAVQLAYRVIPQHIVVEHILPGATPDPGARPRDIEVYADYTDATLRARVRDFSDTHFPEPSAALGRDWDYTPADYPDRFVKIGQFAYEGAELHDGVHVQRLSTELLTLGAATDHVIVRAVSNYGARNQTCFYRVRLYGEDVDAAAEAAARAARYQGLGGTRWGGGSWRFWRRGWW